MKDKLTPRRIAILALLIALNIVLNFFLRLPTPTGFVSLVEVGIILAAWYFGPQAGLIVGALTGFLIDLLLGYPQWMFFSLLIHGSEGYLIGRVGSGSANVSKRILSIVLGGITMVIGYFIAGIILQLLNHAVVKTAVSIAIVEIPSNALQVLVGALVASLIYVPFASLLARTKLH
ncbi:MAG: ECF transporter S component [Lactobacillaceae bacterium]|jgi:uncharacterized membrane protein|nr:ECF transporter S component [Lactobacillaceae bacterium]